MLVYIIQEKDFSDLRAVGGSIRSCVDESLKVYFRFKEAINFVDSILSGLQEQGWEINSTMYPDFYEGSAKKGSEERTFEVYVRMVRGTSID